MTQGEMIRKLRIEKGLSQKELGRKCGLADSAIRRYELGGAKPKLETLHRIAAGLEVSYTVLLPQTDFVNVNTPSDSFVQFFIENQFSDDERERILEYANFLKSQRD